MPLWEGYAAGNRGSVYRWHIPDPVPFKKSLRVEIEHKGSQDFPDKTGSGFIERDDLMSSVAFWYQIEPHKPWPALPPGPERLAEHTLQLVTGWKAVAKAKHSDAPLEVQPLPGISKEGKQLFFRPADDKGWVECTFKLDKDITAHLWGKFIHAPDYGIYRATLDGANWQSWTSTPKGQTRSDHWGVHKLSAGPHVLRLDARANQTNPLGIISASTHSPP